MYFLVNQAVLVRANRSSRQRTLEGSARKTHSGQVPRALHSGNALAFQARVAGSIPAARSTKNLEESGFFRLPGLQSPNDLTCYLDNPSGFFACLASFTSGCLSRPLAGARCPLNRSVAVLIKSRAISLAFISARGHRREHRRRRPVASAAVRLAVTKLVVGLYSVARLRTGRRSIARSRYSNLTARLDRGASWHWPAVLRGRKKVSGC